MHSPSCWLFGAQRSPHDFLSGGADESSLTVLIDTMSLGSLSICIPRLDSESVAWELFCGRSCGCGAVEEEGGGHRDAGGRGGLMGALLLRARQKVTVDGGGVTAR
jgi:hypothetical protein